MLWFARRMYGDFLDEFIIAKQSTEFLAGFLVFGPASNKQKETLDVPCLPAGSAAVQPHVCVVSTPRAERRMSLFVPSPPPTNTKAQDEQKVAKIAKKNHIGFTSCALRPSVKSYRCCTSLNQELTHPAPLTSSSSPLVCNLPRIHRPYWKPKTTSDVGEAPPTTKAGALPSPRNRPRALEVPSPSASPDRRGSVGNGCGGSESSE